MQNVGMNGCSTTRLGGMGALPPGFMLGDTCGDGSVASHVLKFYDGSTLCVPDAKLTSLYGGDALAYTHPSTAVGQQAASDAFTALAKEQMSRAVNLPIGYHISRACIPGVPGSIGGQTGYWTLNNPDGSTQCVTDADLDKFSPGSAASIAAAAQGLFSNTGPVAAKAPAEVAAAIQLAAAQSPVYAASLPPTMLTPTQQQDPAILAAQAQLQAQQSAFQAQEQAAQQQYQAQLAAQQASMQQAIDAYKQANPTIPASTGVPVSQATIDAANAAAQQQIAAAQANIAAQMAAVQQAQAQAAATQQGAPSPAPVAATTGSSLDSITAWATANPLMLGGAVLAIFLLMGRR